MNPYLMEDGQRTTDLLIQEPKLALRSATLIYNPIAGRKPVRREKEIRQAAAVLEKAGIAVQVAATTGPGEARTLAEAAAQGGDEMVVVCGGDGTINEAVNGLAFSETRLAILPGGTANTIAKELGLPHNPVRAARQLPLWRPRLVSLGLATWPVKRAAESREWGFEEKLGLETRDSGPLPTPGYRPRCEVEQRYYLSLCGIGFDAHIVDQLPHDFKMFLGVAAYGLEALRQVTRYKFLPFICRADDLEFEATFATIQRTSRYAGWFHMAPRARFFEPRLNACLFQSRRWPRYFVYLAALAARVHPHLRDVAIVETERVECVAVDPGRPILFELDGELAGTLPATFEVAPNALTLLTPR